MGAIPTKTAQLRQKTIESNIASLLPFLSNLKTASIMLDAIEPLDQNLIYSINNLNNLTSLGLGIEINWNRTKLTDLSVLFPLFSRLLVLRLGGDWYTLNDNNQLEETWKIQTLTITTNTVPIIANCPDLIDLTIESPEVYYKIQSLKPITRAKGLIWLELRHNPRHGPLLDVKTSLSKLDNLRSLSIAPQSLDEIDFLSGKILHNGKLPMPDLTNINITYLLDLSQPNSTIERMRLSHIVNSILCTRKNIICFNGAGMMVNVHGLFAGRLTTPQYIPTNNFWVCSDLEKLSLRLELKAQGFQSREREINGYWRLALKQITMLKKLESLTIHATDISYKEDSPIFGLQPNFMTSLYKKLDSLKKLTLYPYKHKVWSIDDIKILLSLFPNLSLLRIIQYEPDSMIRIKKWLRTNRIQLEIQY